MENKNGKTISRRDFFKIAGAAGMATAGLAACGDRRGTSSSANAGEPGGGMRTTDAPVVFSLWTMTAAYRSSAKPAVASGATNVR